MPGNYNIVSCLSRAVGSVCAVAGGLCAGMQETMGSVGAAVAAIVLYLPIPAFQQFHNDISKREFITSGIACGISVAFGTPIAATIFAFEISRPNSQWKMMTLFYTLGSAVVASSTFAFSTWCVAWIRNNSFYSGESSSSIWPFIETSMLDLNIVLSQDVTWNTIIAAPIIAVVCALIGSAMNISIAYLNKFREFYAHYSILKLLEVSIIASLTITFAFLIPYLYTKSGHCSQAFDYSTNWVKEINPAYFTCSD